MLNRRVSKADVLVRWLGGLGEPELAALLDRRADVLLGAPLRDLAELGERMHHPLSLVTVLRTRALPCLQLAEAAQALGDGLTRAALAQFLNDSGPHHRANVDRVVDELVAHAVVSVDDEGRIALPEAFAEIFPSPLGLGPPLRVLLRDHSVEAMRRIQTRIGLERQRTRAETVAALVAHLGNVDTVRATLASAPKEVAEYLETLATRTRDEEVFLGPHRYRQRQAAIRWAGERGLMIGTPYGYDWQMPAEVARALRGPDFRAGFSPHRPEPARRVVDPGHVDRESAAAATRCADFTLAVLDYVVRVPIPRVKSGGIGTRELTKLAKATAVDDSEARLTLELADAVGLLDRFGQTVVASDGFTAWRDAEPADRFIALLSTWWALGSTPTQSRDADDKPLRVLAGQGDCAGCRDARVSVLATLAGLDGATDRGSLAPAALWQRPLVHVGAQDDDDPFATVWREAEMLGVISLGALSELGRILLAGDAGMLRRHATSLLPTSADHARFGADLTVYVVGAPSARVSAVLDSAADRESRGGAVTWRFSPTSVRRALDEGTTGQALTSALAEIATAELPQPLRYLIADVARRHGNLRLTSVTSCVRGDDVALLAEVAVDRKLARLGLRLLAPTVLASDATVPEMVDALRAAGYFPVSEDRAGNVVQLSARRNQASGGESARIRARTRGRLRELGPEPTPADPQAVAAGLLQGRAARWPNPSA